MLSITSRERLTVASPQDLAAHFADKLSTRASDTTPEPHLEYPSSTVMLHQFRVKKSRVHQVVAHLDPTKSVGDDDISPRVLKQCASSLCSPLTALFRKICHSSILPSCWKISHITPIHKRSLHTAPTTYRPVAVLPTLSNVFERVLQPRQKKHINPFIPPQQFGFMTGSSCADSVVSLARSIITALNQRAEVRLVALDIKGAFDSAWWQGLLCHLQHIGISGLAYELFTSYLSDRFLYVAIREGQSFVLGVSAGVPQVAIWSPLLFNIYIRFLPSVANFTSVMGYIDDHTLLKIIPLKSDQLKAADEINTDLMVLSQFGKQWFIDFAPLKSKSLLISLKHDTMNHPPYNCQIAEVSSLKILGFMFDSSFTWGPHVDMIVSRANTCLSSFLDPPGLSMMYKSFIHSCLEYGHHLYFSAAKSHLKRLDTLQRQAADIYHDTFPSLESRQCAAGIELTYLLLDGEGHGNLQSFCPHFATNVTRRSSRLNDLLDPAWACRLHNPVTFKSLDCFCRSWHAVIPAVWDTLPASLLLQGHIAGWRSVMKALQRSCY